MIFERVFCNISERNIFRFNAVEIFPDIFASKKFLNDKVVLVTTVISSPKDFEEGVKFYNLKKTLWDEDKVPLIIKSGEYYEEENEIKTKVEIYCLNKDLNIIKKKAGL